MIFSLDVRYGALGGALGEGQVPRPKKTRKPLKFIPFSVTFCPGHVRGTIFKFIGDRGSYNPYCDAKTIFKGVGGGVRVVEASLEGWWCSRN